MTSWRDQYSEQAQQDLDELLGTMLPMAEKTLGKHGVVAPFAAGITEDGEVTVLQADGSPDPADRDAVLGDLLTAARAVLHEHRAFAFAAQGNGVQLNLELEHREGGAVALVADYDRSKVRRSVSRTSLKARPATGTLWNA